MAAATEALRVDRLVKHYGSVQALRGIDLQVHPGEVFGFLGPNGAGKSTLIRVVLDLIRPTSGAVSVFGHDCQRDATEARRRLGYLPSDPQLPPRMTALQVFDYLDGVRGTPADRAYRDTLIERLALDPTRNVGTLSRGNRQKVGVVQALMHRPALAILDEPTTGLDPLVQEEFEAIVRETAADGRTVFFSSHILAEVEALCHRAAVVREGRIVDVFDLAEQRRLAARQVEVTFAAPPPPDAFATLPPSVRVLEVSGARVRFQVMDGADALVKALAQFEVHDLIAREPTLEELFLGYYRGEGDAS
ncbi:MAG: ABC transporter ATP-binding protein [Chloroflexota bacterium]